MNVTDIPALLARTRVIAVVGLSPLSSRPSHDVADYLQEAGYRIVPINPLQAGQQILGELCYASLTSAAAALATQQLRIDLVDCFRRSELIESIADEAIALNIPAFWMQLGVINQAAASKLQRAGIQVVMNQCIKIDHRKWRAALAAKALAQ